MKKIILSILITSVFLLVEFYFSKNSIYTFNWIISGVFYMISILSILLFLVLFNLKFNVLSFTFLALGFLIIVPVNMFHLNELASLKAESDEMVHCAYREKIKTGSYPEKIRRKHDSRLSYVKDGNHNFSVSFHIVSPNSGHFYTSKDGWGFMDD